MEEAATHEDPDNSSGNGGTSRQSPAADGSVAVAAPQRMRRTPKVSSFPYGPKPWAGAVQLG